MMPAGLEKVETAKQDGSWNALDAIEALKIPSDLEMAFANYAEAKQSFEAFPRSAKRGILEWIATAKQPETQVKRVNETAQRASQNLRANQWRSLSNQQSMTNDQKPKAVKYQSFFSVF
ncbi:MAG: hypothetical protein HC840_26970 [Leptolyngbyaceae cyanobacterium RM2_2_4]|nr:hypothetical protein [Leptolyngbyaceae cyanobacterium SM1_4_3]NJO52436.1 hypothetical protein [Leptolyngbyaceae cyanobacterium RM2_2_4]NJO67330.1 hypothetical protein [Leptolyngbyaceae cyanobacterium RM1_405_57]